MKTIAEILDDKDRIKVTETFFADIAHAAAEHCGKNYAVAQLKVIVDKDKTRVEWCCYVDGREYTPSKPTLTEMFAHIQPWGDASKLARLKALVEEADQLRKELHLNP